MTDAIYTGKVVSYEYRECDRCKEALYVEREDERAIAYERVSGQRHVCWNLPEDANLVVIDD